MLTRRRIFAHAFAVTGHFDGNVEKDDSLPRASVSYLQVNYQLQNVHTLSVTGVSDTMKVKFIPWRKS
jgi:hypothetical protein